MAQLGVNLPTSQKADDSNAQVSYVKLKVKGTETPEPEPEPCQVNCGEQTQKQNIQTDGETDYGFLNYKLLINCIDDADILQGGNTSCLDNPLFTTIYIGIGSIVVLLVMQSRKQTSVLKIE